MPLNTTPVPGGVLCPHTNWGPHSLHFPRGCTCTCVYSHISCHACIQSLLAPAAPTTAISLPQYSSHRPLQEFAMLPKSIRGPFLLPSRPLMNTRPTHKNSSCQIHPCYTHHAVHTPTTTFHIPATQRFVLLVHTSESDDAADFRFNSVICFSNPLIFTCMLCI